MAALALESNGSTLRQRHNSSSVSPKSLSPYSTSSPHSRLWSEWNSIEVMLLTDLVVTKRLGAGHFAAVDQVFCKTSARFAALKHVSGGLKSMPNRRSLYKEAEVALELCTSGHENIVALLALCYEGCASRNECCEGGDLKCLLKRMHERAGELARDSTAIYRPIRNAANVAFPDEEGEVSDWRMAVVSALLKFALQVSLAMEYLCLRRYVHRDIAARNVLLSKHLSSDPFELVPDQTVKIADFGMCIALGDADEVIRKRKCCVPYKWLPYEFWTHNTYGFEGDVWEFGCFLIEVVTFGGDPCVIVQCNELYRPRADIEQYLSRLSTGFTSLSLVPLIGRCLTVDKSQRATFEEISGYLRNFSPRNVSIV